MSTLFEVLRGARHVPEQVVRDVGRRVAEAHRTAVALLDGVINGQSAVMSFGDTFLATAALLVATVPLIFLLGRPTAGAAAPAGH